MALQLKNRSFLGLRDLDAGDLHRLLDRAQEMKSHATRSRELDGRLVGLLFAVPSTRTRISFQAAIRHLGGDSEQYNVSDLQLANMETIIDTAAVMGRYLDALVVRMYDMAAYGKGRESLVTIAEHSGIPVINALDDKEHPCQVLADLLTLRERFGDGYKRKKVVMAWGYAKRQKSPGVLHSMLSAGALLGMTLTFAYPLGYELDPEYVGFAQRAAAESGARIEHCHDLAQACEGADAVYVKSWKSLRMSKDDEAAYRETLRSEWCLGERHFAQASPGAYFMDCMPLIRGDEATAEVVDGPRSIRYDQAENRLHAQKAVMSALLG
jgi:ornithine carbamoyltransferase